MGIFDWFKSKTISEEKTIIQQVKGVSGAKTKLTQNEGLETSKKPFKQKISVSRGESLPKISKTEFEKHMSGFTWLHLNPTEMKEDLKIYGRIRAYFELVKIDEDFNKNEELITRFLTKIEGNKLHSNYSQKSIGFEFVTKSKVNLYSSLQGMTSSQIDDFIFNMLSVAACDGEFKKSKINFINHLLSQITDKNKKETREKIKNEYLQFWEKKQLAAGFCFENVNCNSESIQIIDNGKILSPFN